MCELIIHQLCSCSGDQGKPQGWSQMHAVCGWVGGRGEGGGLGADIVYDVTLCHRLP